MSSVSNRWGGFGLPLAPGMVGAKSDLSLLTVLGLTLMACGPLVPNHYLPWSAFYSEAVAILGAALLCLAALVRRDAIAWPPIAVGALALSLVPLVQGISGGIFFWGDAWMAFAYLALFGLTITVGHGLTRDERISERLAWMLAGLVIASGLVSVLIELEQWLRLEDLGIFAVEMPPRGRPFANVGQPNLLATWLMLAIVGCLILFEANLIGRVATTCAVVMFTFGVVMTQSRTGWLEMAVLVAWLLSARAKARFKVTRREILAVGAVFALFVLSWPTISESVFLDASRSLKEQTEGGTRWAHWNWMVDAISRHPWAGYGWNQVSVAQTGVASSHPRVGEMTEHSHNIVLDILIWNGVPIGLLVIGAFSWWMITRVRACRDARIALLLGAIAIVLTHGLLEFPLEYAYFLLPVGLMIGIVESSVGRTQVVRIPWAWTAGLAAALCVLLVWVCIDYRIIEDNNREMRFELARIGAPRNPPSQAPDVMLLTQQREFLRFARTQATRDMSPQQLQWMRQVADRFGYPPVLFRYALAQGLNRDPRGAADTLARLCAIHPAVRCHEGLAAWSEMSAGPFPELKGVHLPP